MRNLSLIPLAGLLTFSATALIRDNLAMEREEIAIAREKAAYLQDFPRQNENTAAFALRKKAASLGVTVDNPYAALGSVSVKASEKQAFHKIEKTLERYLNTQTAKTTNRFDGLPLELSNYFNPRARELRLLRNSLRFYKTPDWGRNNSGLEGNNAEPVPNLVGLVRLQNLLLVDAIAQYNRGNSSQVFDNLDAAWQLSESLKKRPEISYQQLYLKLVRTHLALLRRIDNLPPQWQQRLSQRNYRASVASALETEAWIQYAATHRFRPYNTEKSQPFLTLEEQQGLKWQGMAGRTYLRQKAIEDYQALQRLRESLPTANLCTLAFPQPSEQKSALHRDFSSISGGLQEVLRELARTEIEVKQTQQMLQLKQSSAKASPLLPASKENNCAMANEHQG